MGFPADICYVCQFFGYEECVYDAEIDDYCEGADDEGEGGEIEISGVLLG